MDATKDRWEESYQRKENFIFYPKEETVKFLNRFIRKKIGSDKFIDIIDFSKEVKGLDFGCGIGRSVILMREFGIDAYGVDISLEALRIAKQLSLALEYKDMDSKFIGINGPNIPFKDNFFDITISEGVLDSMYFEIAIKSLKEICRVTKRLVFISLISADCRHNNNFSGEGVVQEKHEAGTVQSYYNWEKIQRLLSATDFKIDWCHLITEEDVISKDKNKRYYIVLSKK